MRDYTENIGEITENITTCNIVIVSLTKWPTNINLRYFDKSTVKKLNLFISLIIKWYIVYC